MHKTSHEIRVHSLGELVLIVRINIWICMQYIWLHHVCIVLYHGDVIQIEHFPRYWPFVRGIHRSPVNSPHKGQWREALMFSLICDPFQHALTWILLWLHWANVKLLIWIIVDSKSRCLRLFKYLMNTVSMQLIPTSPLPKSPVSEVTKRGVRWLQLIRTQIILTCAKTPTYLINGNSLILHGISIFGIDCPFPNATDLQGVYYQSQENASPTGHHGCNAVTFFIWDYFATFC